METRLVDDPVWFQPVPALARLAGQRVLIVDPTGKQHEGILLVNLSKDQPLRYSIRVINRIKCYLTSEAIQMLQPTGKDGLGPDLKLNLAE